MDDGSNRIVRRKPGSGVSTSNNILPESIQDFRNDDGGEKKKKKKKNQRRASQPKTSKRRREWSSWWLLFRKLLSNILLRRTMMISMNLVAFIYCYRMGYLPDYDRMSLSMVRRRGSPRFPPRCMGYYFRNTTSDSFLGAQRMNPYLSRRFSQNIITMNVEELQGQIRLNDSYEYDYGRADVFEQGDCVARYDWQIHSFPTCNSIHEMDLTNQHALSKKAVQVALISGGYWRDVWMLKDFRGHKVALKTMRYTHEYEERNFERHRRDSVASERLTASPNVVDIYGFCGNSALHEFAAAGDIGMALWYSDVNFTTIEKLIVAYQVASAMSDLHSFPKDGGSGGYPAIVHTDINTNQFLFLKGRYKMTDFNRCRFLAWNKTSQTPCPFYVGNNPGKFRSPEEYEYAYLTEKIDIYSMGNIFYALLTEEWPFRKEENREAQRKVMDGKRPDIPPNLQNSTDPATVALYKVTQLCWKQDPKERPNATQVVTMIDSVLEELGVVQDENTTA
eukprot:CAMPEP_0116842838 /NCGR_PEP_ID=MMETSP0418-20121206/11741_1 /TAXON_ID=1158023 /ORGANISM="Astrosyne radiata, Strain 13vi08-1A" /LENGTH=505 /DNA_ID=CAMNT_0004473497 /DNA_START=424 /DNA_END=1941 /DNA_ORIENTATION=-